MTQGEIEGIPLPFQQAVRGLEARILSDIVRRLRINGSVTASAEWQYDRLRQLGESDAYIRSQIQVMLGVTDQEIDRLFSGMMSKAGEGELAAVIQAAMEQTKNTFRNLSASLGFAIRGLDGRIYHTGLLDYYRDTLDAAVLDISSGAFSYDTVLRRTINQMTNSGLRWIDYDTGHHNRVDVAARRAVMTGFNQIQAKINEQTARRLGTDYFEVSYHRGARQEHQVWQGRVYSSAELKSVCGLGSVEGLCGANCYHWYDAFVPGVSVRTYTDGQLKQMMAEENTPREYDGKEYTLYEALQRQRRLETLMRKQREDIRLLKEGEAEEDAILAAASRYRSSMSQYVDFSEAMDLPQQMERVHYGSLGIPSKTLEKLPSSAIIKLTAEEQRALNRYIGSESYVLNDKLRRREKLSTEDREWMEALDNALDKMPEYHGTVYRSMSDFGLVDVCGFIQSLLLA